MSSFASRESRGCEILRLDREEETASGLRGKASLLNAANWSCCCCCCCSCWWWCSCGCGCGCWCSRGSLCSDSIIRDGAARPRPSLSSDHRSPPRPGWAGQNFPSIEEGLRIFSGKKKKRKNAEEGKNVTRFLAKILSPLSRI